MIGGVMLNRKEFILGTAAMTGAYIVEGAEGVRPNLKVGIVSDTHIQDEASARHFENALRYFRDCGVDAVMHVGDIGDWGLVSAWRYAADAWEKVFPDDCAPDGRRVVKLFTTGNHDFEGIKYWDQKEEMYAQGYAEDELLVDNDMAGQWERFFGEPFKPVVHKRVKGYDFITTHWNHRGEIAEWMMLHGDEIDRNKPFFFFQHVNPDDTIAAGCSGDGGVARKAFDGEPNAVVIGGHTHLSITDGHQIWQGGFTAVGAASLSWSELPFGYENARQLKAQKGYVEEMPSLQDRFYQRVKQGMVMSVYDNRIVFEKRDFTHGCELDAPWIVHLPVALRKPYAPSAHAAATPVPRFRDDARVLSRTVVGENRRGMKSVQMVLDFPSAVRNGVRAYDYEIWVEPANGEGRLVSRVVSPTYNCGFSHECKAVQAVFSVRKLPKGVPYRIAVYPRNCFGGKGNPIRTDVCRAIKPCCAETSKI
jgi:predicted phosphodiesterase